MERLTINRLKSVEELKNFCCDVPKMDAFITHYPALEISYLAVDKKYQRRHIGEYIVAQIEERARTQKLAGCQFLTVGALVLPDYSAVPFYTACNFAKLEPIPTNEVLRMYHNLLTK